MTESFWRLVYISDVMGQMERILEDIGTWQNNLKLDKSSREIAERRIAYLEFQLHKLNSLSAAEREREMWKCYCHARMNKVVQLVAKFLWTHRTSSAWTLDAIAYRLDCDLAEIKKSLAILACFYDGSNFIAFASFRVAFLEIDARKHFGWSLFGPTTYLHKLRFPTLLRMDDQTCIAWLPKW